MNKEKSLSMILSIVLLSLFFPKLLVPEINVYFSHSVDTALANPNNAQGFIALDEKLINRISQTQYSIDFCFYNIKRQNIVDSLISAFVRGVDVRVITEHDHIDNQAIQDLISAGIPVIDDTFGNNSGDGFMHNKFAIFDFRDSTSTIDDWIWTGSYNITDTGTESNANNAVEIQYDDIARAYTLEFEEMWGSNTNIPDPDSSKFSSLKTDNTKHYFIINSIPVELYFSPSDHSTQYIRNAVSTADSTIYFCIFCFTYQNLCDEMKLKWDSGISVKGVFDKLDWLGYYSKSRDMTGDPTSNNPWSPPAPVFLDSVTSPWGYELLHHKYMIIDSDCSSLPLVITGSQNWSNNGELYNDENTLIIHSQDIANQYLQEFVERYREAGGEYVGCAEKENNWILENRNLKLSIYPNPFSDIVNIECCIGQRAEGVELKIYDVSGRLVKSFSLPTAYSLLSTVIPWDGRDNRGQSIPGGIYFLKLKSGEFAITKDLILIR